MAIDRFFQELMQVHSEEALKDQREKAAAFHENAIKQLMGGDLEAYQQTLQRINSLSALNQEQTAALDQWLNEEFIPLINSKLEERGIQIPDVQFLSRFRTFEPENLNIRFPHVLEPEIKLEEWQRRLVLAPKQYKATEARMRLVDNDAPNGLSLEQSVDMLYSPEEIGVERKMFVYRTVNASFRQAVAKLESGVKFLADADDIDQITLPFTEDQIAKFNFSPKMVKLYTRINQAPAYQGLTLPQIVKLTQDTDKVLVTQPVQEDHEDGDKFTPDAFSNSEIYHLIYQISRHGDDILASDDLDYVDQTLGELAGDHINADNKLFPEFQNALLQKLSNYSNMSGQRRTDFFEAQSEIGQFILGVVTSKWNSPGKLRDLLEISEESE